MSNPKNSVVLKRLQDLLREPHAHAHEPALEPILIARYLLHCDGFDADIEDRAVLRSFRRSVRDYHLSRVEEFGWLRVPPPSIDEMAVWVGEYIKDAQAFGRRVLMRREVSDVARTFAKLAVKMWPVVAYFTLELAIDALFSERVTAPGFLYEVGVDWPGEGGNTRPVIVAMSLQADDIHTRIWNEAAVLLAAQAPSHALKRMLEAKVSKFTGGRLGSGAELLGVRPLIRTRFPRGTPFQAVEYLNTVLRNQAITTLTLRGAPEGSKLSTLRRYWTKGLSRNATAVEVAAHAQKQANRRAHRKDGCMTKRQLALKLNVTMRSLERALCEAERRLARPRPMEDGATRLDAGWVLLIKNIVEEPDFKKPRKRP